MRPHETMNLPFKPIVMVLLVAASLGACSSGTSPSPDAPDTPGGRGSPSVSPPPDLSILSASPNTSAGLKIGDPVAIQGKGFNASTHVFLGDREVTPLDVAGDRIRFSYAPDLAGLVPGSIPVSVQNAGGTKITENDVFFYFPSPAWKAFPNFLNGRVRDLALSSSQAPLLASDEGAFYLQDGLFQRSASGDIEICGPEAQNPGCPAGFEDLCFSPAPASCFLVKQIESLPSNGHSFALAEKEDSGERRVLTSTDGHAWQLLPPFDSNPLSIKTTQDSLYVLTSDALTAGTPGAWDYTIPLSNEMKAIVAADATPPFGDYPIEILEKTGEVDFAVGTPKGLFQSAHVPGSPGSPAWLFSGPSANCGNVNGMPTVCGPKITALAVDPAQDILYFSYVPHETWPSGDNGAVEKLKLGFINAGVAASIPWVYGLAFMDGNLLAVGWSPSAKDKDSIIYKIGGAGSAAHIYSRFQTLGFPSLPATIGDEVTMIHEEGGTFYAYLKARRCLLASPDAPTPGASLECLETLNHFHQGIEFLFIQEGTLLASSLEGTFAYNPSKSVWEASSMTASESLRQDLDLSLITHEEGLPESAQCALSVPDLDLVFACTPHGAYVSFRNGPWTQIGGDSPIVSLAYAPQTHSLYGASNTQGIFQFPLP